MTKSKMSKHEYQQDTEHGMMSFVQLVRNHMTCCTQMNRMVPGQARRNLDAEAPLDQIGVNLRTISLGQIIQLSLQFLAVPIHFTFDSSSAITIKPG